MEEKDLWLDAWRGGRMATHGVWASKLSPRAQRDEDGIWVRVGALKRRTRGEIPELSWRRREAAVRACPSDGDFNHLPHSPGTGV